MELREMTKLQLKKLIIEQDKMLKQGFNLLQQILRDWKFWTKVNMGITIAWFMLGITFGLIIGMK